jgi:tetratricopeptide (TPR) repeat protein
MLYNWGYSNYVNPYYTSVAVPVASQPVVYDYSTPINVQSAPPEQSTTDVALQTFDSAREAFKNGDFATALKLADQAIAKMPNDASLHEFRALVLFALGRYEEAAAPLYAVLAVGPGWDWTTLIGLYPSIDVYTEQLRALEAYVRAHTNSAPARFVLAYQYLTQGHNDAAIDQLKQVVALQPSDKLSAQLIQQLSKASATGSAPAQEQPPQRPQPPEQPQPPADPGQQGTLSGTFTAKPDADTTISLTIQPEGHFVWKVTQKGQSRQFEGESTFGNGILTLAQKAGGAMVGKVTKQDDNHFTFQVMGAPPGDPGLSFSR